MVALAFGLPLFLGCNVVRAPKYVIPDGYRGWVVVGYDFPSCPEATRQGWQYLTIRVDGEGRGCTSDSRPVGLRLGRSRVVEAESGKWAPGMRPGADPWPQGPHGFGYYHSVAKAIGEAPNTDSFVIFYVGEEPVLTDDESLGSPEYDVEYEKRKGWFDQFR